MNKGTRVSITSGKGRGVEGEVFWTGPNKWGEGERLGVRGDDGETYWVADADVEVSNAPAPVVEAGPTFAKGDRVAFKQRGEEGTGSVFWIGESRGGPGQRLGIRNDADEEAVWLDARFARAIEGEAPPRRASGGGGGHGGGGGGYGGEPDSEEPWSAPVGMGAVEGPPIDDSYVDLPAGDDEDDGYWEGPF